MNSPSIKTTEDSRRHDLDALRAIAMLLGIVLHGILSFAPPFFPWIVQDSQYHELWLLPFSVIHGFRMPLFFLISGYFTMMLFMKRGVGSLLWHRFRRIFLPLLIGLVTIIPLGQWIGYQAIISNGPKQDNADPMALFWQAAFDGDLAQIKSIIDSGNADLGAFHPEFGVNPMTLAAFTGNHELATLLLESGADVNAASRDGNASVHTAAFKGDYRMFMLLRDAGADIEQKNGDGSTARMNCDLDWNTTKWISDMLRMNLERETVLAGRKKIIANIEGSDEVAAPQDQSESIEIDEAKPSSGDNAMVWLTRKLLDPGLLQHLWFLWSLFLLVIAFGVLATIGSFIPGLNRIPSWLLLPPVSLMFLVPLTAWSEVYMDQVFGPDTSSGLIPNFNLLAYYGLFFGYGAIYFSLGDEKGKLGWWWMIAIPICLFGIYPAASAMLYGENPNRLAAAALESVYVWLMIFASMSLFSTLFSRKSKVMRYVSDSSYWLYVAHLPLVLWLQMTVRHWDWSSPAKAAFVIGVTTIVLLVSYQLFVRHTPVGWLLNGKRKRQSATSSPNT